MYEPIIFNRSNGGFLAMTPPDSQLRIAVTAATEDTVRSNFREAVERWELLLRSAANESGTDDEDA